MQHAMHLFLDSWFRGGHMMDMDRGFWGFPGLLFGLLPLIVLFLLAAWAIRVWSGNRQRPVAAGAAPNAWQVDAGTMPSATRATPPASTSTPVVESALDVLQMRYAKGEISRAEYETIRADILRDRRGEATVAPVSPAAVTPAAEPAADAAAPTETTPPAANDDETGAARS